jgi:WD40 repeat protein
MTEAQPPKELVINNRALNKLIRAITLSQGNFSLILVRCNYRSVQNQVVQQLKAECSVAIREMYLPPSTKTLYTTIRAELGEDSPPALMIFGLEQVVEIEQVLISTNQVREEFRKHFLFPIVLWVNDETLKRLIQLMPDFKSWTGNSIKFEIAPTELAQSLHQSLNELLSAILNVGEGKFLKLAMLHPRGADLSFELASALIDLRSANPIDRLQASLQFWAGREADLRGDKTQAKADYEQSIAFWQTQTTDGLSSDDWANYGCVLFHLGLWWRQYATQHRSEYQTACLQAKDFYQQSLAAFEKTERPELVAKFINTLGEVLTRLGAWDELVTVAQRAVRLHQTYPEPIRLAYAHALLAEVALQRQDWQQLREQAELALQTNDLRSPSSIDWAADRAQRQNFYRLLLAQAQRHLNQVTDAIVNLETAQANFNPQYDPTVYIRILATLRSLYFEQDKYLQAFETKQEQRSIEQQYGLRAFVGAGRLQSRRQVINPGLATVDPKAAVTQEIAASGRLIDVNHLLERIGRDDHKLTVIYGQSGVGKSSLVQAGLVPALKQQAIDARNVVPVLLQVYTDWSQTLGDRLAESLAEVHGLSLPLFLDSMAAFVAEIQKNGDKNLLTVLIFDQFEEFFFAYKDPAQRRPFFEFLRDCLDVPYVKVILSLREDYLHYLLECNRLIRLEVINNNILDKKILYHLGNFSPADGRAVIQSLTDAGQFSLESALLDELVRDLAGDLNEVRPIELQVVGAQMQTERVSTLAQYIANGPKESFVGRFLEEVVTDCGTNNEQFAKIILYLLTDDNLTRPLKTSAELEADLSIAPERLGLILNILVKSGLVFQVPGFPADRYQLVHDYLVSFVRQQQAAGLVAELEKEREQRKLTEEKLNQALKKQLKTARRSLLTLTGLVVAIGGFAIAATVTGINLYISNLVSESGKNKELDKLVSVIKAGQALKAFPVAISGLKLFALSQMNEAIFSLSELNRLEGHTGTVTQVIFSPNGKLIASISEDKTAKIWGLDGNLLKTLEESQGKITSVSFSADSKLIAYAGEDKKIRFGTVEGKQIKILPTNGMVSDISFSPNGKLLAASINNTVRLFNLLTGKETYIFKGHDATISTIGFSPDGKMIASADQDDVVKLWGLDGTELQSINNYGTIGIQFSADGKILILTNKDRSIKQYSLDGTLVKSTRENYRSDKITAAALSSNGRDFATASQNSTEINLTAGDDDYRSHSVSGHSDLVTYLSFSPNGEILASASQDKTIKLWKVNSKSFIPENNIQKIQFSHDGQTIAAINSYKTIRLLDKQGKLKQILNGDGSIFSFSPDGKSIITGSADDTIKMWNVKTRKEVIFKGHPSGIAHAAISPDGKKVFSVGNDGTLKFWHSDGRLIKTEAQPSKKINNLVFSPDSELVALREENGVHLWRSDGKRVGDFSGHANQISEIIFSPDSDLIATSGDDNLVKLWRKDGTLINVLTGHTDKIRTIEFSPDSQVLASISQDMNGTIKLWQRDGKLITTILSGISAQSLQFSPDNKTIAVINYIKDIQLWNLEGQLIATLSHNGEVTDLNFSPDGKVLASASADNNIRLWDQSGKLMAKLRGHSDKVNKVMFNPVDGQTIISASDDGMVQMWKRDGTKLKTLQLADRKPDSNENESKGSFVAFGDNGKIIIVAKSVSSRGKNSTALKIWNSDGDTLKEFQTQTDFDKISISSDGKSIAWVNQVNDFQLLNLQGSILATFAGHHDVINSVSVSPDGKFLASASNDKTVGLWTQSGHLIKKLNHTGKVNSVSFSADGKVLASASDDKQVKLWNQQGQELSQLSHIDKVNVVKFSPVGNVLASASDDKTVKLWDQLGQLKSTLPHLNKVSAIKFSRDGKMLASTSQDNVAKLWKVSGGKEIIQPIDNVSSTAFSPDSTILSTSGSSYIRFAIPHGLWFQGVGFSINNSFSDLQFSPDQTTLATIGQEVSIVDFDLDRLLSKACGLAKNYLAHNPNVKESDRHLCDGIAPEK